MTPPAGPRTLQPPAGLRYDCLRCGRSCCDWSEIEVEPEEASLLRRLPLFAPGLPAAASGLPYRSGDRAPGQLVLATVADGDGGCGERCALLTAEHLCAVHAAHGAEAKPASCRGFPLFVVDTPGGAFGAASFACTAVARGHGAPLADPSAWAEVTHRERRGHDLRLAPGEPLRFADYLALEAELQAAFAAAGDPIAGLLAMARRLRPRTHPGRPLDPRPSPRLRARTLAWLAATAGSPARFRPPAVTSPSPDREELLGRWLAHRIHRKDLLRGDEVGFGFGLLVAETALALSWAAQGCPGGLPEAIAQVERGLAVHSDFLARLLVDEPRRTAGARLWAAPRYAASLLGG